MSSDNRKTYIYILYFTIYNKYKYAGVNMSPPRHAGGRARPRGRAKWPCMPRHVHVGSRDKVTFFLLIFNCFN